MKMFRHDHVSDNDEAITLTSLFEDGEEAIAAARSTKKRQPPGTGTGDKVQMMSAVSAMQTGRHKIPWYRQHGTRPCKKRRSGAPAVSERERKNRCERLGHPPGFQGFTQLTEAAKCGTPGAGRINDKWSGWWEGDHCLDCEMRCRRVSQFYTAADLDDASRHRFHARPGNRRARPALYSPANMWIANRGDGTVTKMQASNGTVLGTFSVPLLPYGVAFDGTNIWVSSAKGTTELRVSDGATLGTFPGQNGTGIAFDGANMWVALTRTVQKY